MSDEITYCQTAEAVRKKERLPSVLSDEYAAAVGRRIADDGAFQGGQRSDPPAGQPQAYIGKGGGLIRWTPRGYEWLVSDTKWVPVEGDAVKECRESGTWTAVEDWTDATQHELPEFVMAPGPDKWGDTHGNVWVGETDGDRWWLWWPWAAQEADDTDLARYESHPDHADILVRTWKRDSAPAVAIAKADQGHPPGEDPRIERAGGPPSDLARGYWGQIDDVQVLAVWNGHGYLCTGGIKTVVSADELRDHLERLRGSYTIGAIPEWSPETTTDLVLVPQGLREDAAFVYSVPYGRGGLYWNPAHVDPLRATVMDVVLAAYKRHLDHPQLLVRIWKQGEGDAESRKDDRTGDSALADDRASSSPQEPAAGERPAPTPCSFHQHDPRNGRCVHCGERDPRRPYPDYDRDQEPHRRAIRAEDRLDVHALQAKISRSKTKQAEMHYLLTGERKPDLDPLQRRLPFSWQRWNL